MKLFRRNTVSHEEHLRHEAGLTNGSNTETDRAFGAAALSPVDGARVESSNYNTYSPAEADDDEENAVLETEVAERILEIEAMTVDELLWDSANSIARAELDDEEDSEYYLAHSAAISARALVLQLRLNQNR